MPKLTPCRATVNLTDDNGAPVPIGSIVDVDLDDLALHAPDWIGNILVPVGEPKPLEDAYVPPETESQFPRPEMQEIGAPPVDDPVDEPR